MIDKYLRKHGNVRPTAKLLFSLYNNRSNGEWQTGPT